MAELASEIHDSTVPVGIWVGPSGARAKGLPGQLLGAAAVTGHGARHPHRRLRRSRSPVDGFDARLRQRHRAAAHRHARVETRPGPGGALKPGVDDRGTPTLGDFVVVLDGVQYHGQDARHRRGGAAGRPAAPPGASPRPASASSASCPASCTPWPARRSPTCSSSSACACWCSSSSPPASAWPAWSARSASCSAATALLALPEPAVGVRPAHRCRSSRFAVDVQTGVPRFWTGVGVVALRRGLVVPLRLPHGLAGSPCRRHRRRAAGLPRRHAVDGAGPLRHADHRAGLDGRPAGRGRRWPSTRRASWRSTAPSGGPAPTGPRPSPPGRPGAGRGHRRRHARGGARGRAAPRTTESGPAPPPERCDTDDATESAATARDAPRVTLATPRRFGRSPGI